MIVNCYPLCHHIKCITIWCLSFICLLINNKMNYYNILVKILFFPPAQNIFNYLSLLTLPMNKDAFLCNFMTSPAGACFCNKHFWIFVILECTTPFLFASQEKKLFNLFRFEETDVKEQLKKMTITHAQSKKCFQVQVLCP